MKLLIDENLSPLLARWANDLGLEAEAAIYVGLQGKSDLRVWRSLQAGAERVTIRTVDSP